MLLLCLVGRAWADEIRVCVRPPNVPANVGRWSYTTGTGTLLTSDAALFAMMAHGHDIYIFDPHAPPENTRRLLLPYNKLPELEADNRRPPPQGPSAQAIPPSSEILVRR